MTSSRRFSDIDPEGLRLVFAFVVQEARQPDWRVQTR